MPELGRDRSQTQIMPLDISIFYFEVRLLTEKRSNRTLSLLASPPIIIPIGGKSGSNSGRFFGLTGSNCKNANNLYISSYPYI